MKRYCGLFMILMFLNGVIGANDYSPGSLGAAGSFQGFSTGVDALRCNPANLMFPRKGNNELIFLLPSFSGFLYNSTIPNSALYYYNFHYWGFDPFWTFQQKDGFEEESFRDGSQNRFIQEIKQNTNINLGGNYDLFAITIGNWGFRSSLMSNTRLSVNKNEAVDGNYTLSTKTRLQDGTETSIDRAFFSKAHLRHLTVIENSFSWAVPIEDNDIPLNSIFGMPQASIGFSFKYLMGLGYADITPNVTVRDTVHSTALYRGSYLDWQSAGFGFRIADDSTTIEDVDASIGGHGLSFDFGIAWYDERTAYSFSVNNLLGFIYWGSHIYDDKIYGYNWLGDPDAILIDNTNDEVKLYTNDGNNQDTRSEIKTQNNLITPYPTTINLGFAHYVPFDTKINWLSKSIRISAALEQGLWNSARTTVIPRVSFGVQNGFLYDVVPMRLGIAFGADEDISFSGGFGIDMKYLVFNADIRSYKSLYDYKSNGVAVAAGFKYVFGFDGDPDKDGIPNSKDQCDKIPEDFDGFEDEDGCPEWDNDRDGIPDTLDMCVNTPEDLDGFQDNDGCPDYDNDMDLIPDSLDKCPMDPEDKDGFEDEDGCPDWDNDNDMVPDSLDKCPNEAGLKENNGCPDFDRDKDGIMDAVDKCPDAPETYNSYMDDDGCPDTPPEPKKEEIRIIKQALLGIKFKINSYEILESTIGQLDQVAVILNNYPYLRYLIEGHTDITGPHDYNVVLSRLRARSVKDYLVSKGIADERFVLIGFGPDRPIASNKNESGRKQNRRIEFVQIMSNDEYTQLKAKSEENLNQVNQIFDKTPVYRKKLGL
ncbi:MAG: OmpA family protein [Candidatus Delongbacteria bacterium]|nr:OmpA family protein [Candidatus Delongbacteria bacterium]